MVAPRRSGGSREVLREERALTCSSRGFAEKPRRTLLALCRGAPELRRYKWGQALLS